MGYNPSMWVHDLADASAEHGGKAVNLARLIRAGLPVPDGLVVSSEAFRALAGDIDPAELDAVGHVLGAAADRLARAPIPSALEAEVARRAASLGPRVAVRSSATFEDRDGGAAAGVFSSYPATAIADVWPMIRAVWASALTPLAAIYAQRRAARIEMGVIVQRSVGGEVVTIYTRPPGAPDGADVLVQRGEKVTRVSRAEAERVADRAHEAHVGQLRLAALAIRAERAIGAARGADVELVGEMIVQARPIVHPTAPARMAAPPSVIAPLVADGRRWTWDVSHNPDPLSLAQTGLVERIDRAQIAPWSLRVCAGFLYSAPRGASVPVAPPSSREELSSRVEALEAAMERALGTDTPPLAEAIDRYVAFYAIWATELGPLIAACRRALTPSQLAGARPSAVEMTLLAAARGELDEAQVIAALGMLSPAWDVAVPTYGERPEVLRAAIGRARVAVQLVRSTSDAPADVDLARAAADLAERDDVWFARAQQLVRAALLAHADASGVRRDDIMWLPLDEVLALAPESGHALRIAKRAAASRSAAARAARWQMPMVIGGDPVPSRPPLRGIGTGPRITGRVVRFASLAAAVDIGPGDIVVTRAVTPALAVMVIGCAALVSETGGLLDHGAALARELGISCVVGCHDAWGQLADGMVITVDGERGIVELHAETGTSATQSSSSS